MNTPICVLATSPRMGGNSHCMAQHFVRGVESLGGQAEILFLHSMPVLPCRACYACATAPNNRCILSKKDQAWAIFQKIAQSSLLFVTAPIYFYHVQAQCKALIDRTQALWLQKEKQSATTQEKTPHKPAIVGLVAARTRGDKLFEGSLLTLRYFLQVFDMYIHDTCLMTGYDTPTDLARDTSACARIYRLGQEAQTLIDKV